MYARAPTRSHASAPMRARASACMVRGSHLIRADATNTAQAVFEAIPGEHLHSEPIQGEAGLLGALRGCESSVLNRKGKIYRYHDRE